MPLPDNWTLVPVTWPALVGHDGTPCTGRVRFDSAQVVTADGGTYVPAPVYADVVDGVMAEVELPSTDDPEIAPTGWTWRVTALVSPSGPTPFRIFVPAAGGPINLATVLPVETPPAVVRYATVDSTGHIPDAQIPDSIARATEVAAVAQAVTDEATARADAVAAESTARANADADLDTRLDTAEGTLGALPSTYASVVAHGATAGTARPAGAVSVLWAGTVAPANAVDGDGWLNLSNGDQQVKVAGSFVVQNRTANDARYAGTIESPVVGFIRSLERPTRDLYVIACGDSTFLQTDPWIVKLFRDHLGPQFPAWSIVYDKWNDATNATDTPVTIQTGTGAFTVHILNLSMSGKTSFYYLTASRWTKFTGYGGCDLLLYSQGFNEQVADITLRARFLASIESLRTVYPATEVVIVAENAGGSPLTGTAIDNQAKRAQVIRSVAGQRGYGLVDNHDLFTKNPNYVADWLQADGIHPNDAGMTAIANEVTRLFTFPSAAKIGAKTMQAPAFHTADNLLPFGDLVGWDGTGLPPGAAAMVGTVTVSKDTSIWETKGYSVKLVGGGAGTTDYGAWDVPVDMLPSLKYGEVTAVARIYVPSGQTHNNAGRVGLDIANDGQSNIAPSGTTVTGGYEGTDGWRWAAVSIMVTSVGTRVRARIYCNLSSDTSGGVVYVDRIVVVRGAIPREASAAKSLTQNITTPTTGFGFPFTVDPQTLRGSDSTTMTANRAIFMRVRDGGSISKIALQVATSSGNIDVGVYSNSGTGRTAVPGTKLASSGSVACPAAGYAEISLGTTVTVQPGDWLAISCDNATAAIRSVLSGYITSGMGNGRSYIRDTSFPLPGSNPTSLQATLGPAIPLVGV